jgi:hypothetical protein
MDTLRAGTIFVIVFALAGRPLSAQICTGGPALIGNPGVNVGAGASFFDGGKQYGVGATVGSTLFAGAAFSYADFDDTDLSLKSISGGLGYELRPASPAGLSVCPAVGVGYGFGLEILGVDVSVTTIAPSLAAGISVEMSPNLSLVPFARGTVLFQRGNVDAGPLGEESDWGTDGELSLGAGFLFNERVSIGPSVSIPIARDDGDTIFGIGFTVALGS